jgi:hypothetical protein
MMHGTVGHTGGPASGNWIAVSRDMRDHPIVGMGQPVKPEDPSRGSLSRYEAWQDLLMEAKWKPFEVSNKGKVITLQRGQLMAARAWLARRWNWSEKAVRVFLARLEAEFMVRPERGQSTGAEPPEQGQSKGQRSGHYVNVLTICNYDIYQAAAELDELIQGQSGGQSPARAEPDQGQSRANQGPQINKETKKQITTQHSGKPVPRSRADLDRLQSRLIEAANGALADPVGAPGLLSLAEPIRWLENGFDLELDVVPTIRARSSRQRPRSVCAWTFFTNAIAEAKARRETPIDAAPASLVRRPPPRTFAQQREDAANAALMADVEAIRRRGPARPAWEQIEDLEELQ